MLFENKSINTVYDLFLNHDPPKIQYKTFFLFKKKLIVSPEKTAFV